MGFYMDTRVVNLKEKADLIKDFHRYKLIAELNDYQFKLVKAKREFILHTHDVTDEVFFVVDGKMKLQIEEKIFDLKEGEMIVVPKGKLQKPICETVCTVLLIEPKGTINTGNVDCNLTDNELEWI